MALYENLTRCELFSTWGQYLLTCDPCALTQTVLPTYKWVFRNKIRIWQLLMKPTQILTHQSWRSNRRKIWSWCAYKTLFVSQYHSHPIYIQWPLVVDAEFVLIIEWLSCDILTLRSIQFVNGKTSYTPKTTWHCPRYIIYRASCCSACVK